MRDEGDNARYALPLAALCGFESHGAAWYQLLGRWHQGGVISAMMA
jgi:hypothetical protein